MLSVKNLSVSFHTRNGSSQAVKGLNFDIGESETLAIVGESGSGKSISCYSILGLVPCPPGRIDSGSIVFREKNILGLSDTELRKIRGRKISMIFQDPMTSLNPYMRIGDQIIEAILVHEKTSKENARTRAIAALDEVGIVDAVGRLDRYPHEFSGGMRQRVMIAMALASEPDLLIADEPTTALDVTIQAQILKLLACIQARRKLAIIFISHDLAVVRNIADRVIVMKDGEIVEQNTPHILFTAPQHPYTKALIEAIPRTQKASASADETQTQLVSIKNLSTEFRFKTGPFWGRKLRTVSAVKNVNLDIRQGEILGLVGESGSGKSTLGRSLMRLVPPSAGSVVFSGIDLLTLNDADLKSQRHRFQMIFQDPYASLNPRMTVFATLKEALNLTQEKQEKNTLLQRVVSLVEEVGLKASDIKKYPHEFSGGQRQRIAIARALACEPELIIADEPVSALDVTIQAQIMKLLLKLSKERSLTMLFISHDLSVVRYMCDRVAVMRAGEIVETGNVNHIFEHAEHTYTKELLAAIPLAN